MLQIGDTFQDGGAVFKVKKFGADGALVGSVTWYAGAGTPENYLLCDGSAVSRTNYADLLRAVIPQPLSTKLVCRILRVNFKIISTSIQIILERRQVQ